MKHSYISTLTCFIWLVNVAIASDVSVGNVSLVGRNMSAGPNNIANYVNVQFDITWENSWRTSSAPGNWDAAWVFIKYRVGNGAWYHAYLDNAGYTAPAGSTIGVGLHDESAAFHVTSNPGTGAFIYRSGNGSGTFSLSEVRLKWNYRANSAFPVDDLDNVDIKVFAIEMVYVPEGAFYVGSGGTEANRFFRADNNTQPFLISSEGPITTASTGGGNLWGAGTLATLSPANPHTIPAAFPKGYQAFYCMKYEIAQMQYVEFLNTLTRTQQNARVNSTIPPGTTSLTTATRWVLHGGNPPEVANSRRNGVRCEQVIPANDPVFFYCDLTGPTYSSGTFNANNTDDGQWLVCGHLTYMDVSAYMDWSGLRPMTELEYEKACRGTAAPVANEYAWGTPSLANQVYTLSNPGQANEQIASNYSTTAGNAACASTNGTSGARVFRVGVFATTTSTRVQAGASYYGIMELSGSVWERVVTVANTTGRVFTGIHGNGELSSAGHANEAAWPGLASGEVTGSTGSGFRGGCVGAGAEPYMRVSDRQSSHGGDNGRNYAYGGRGVRTAP